MTSRIRPMAPLALLFGLILVAGFGVNTTFAEGEAMDITGSWKVTGWNPGKARTAAPDYTGMMEVTKRSEGCYSLLWVVGAAKSKQPGIAVYDKNTGVLSAAYVAGGKAGVVLYRPDGKQLKGIWSMDGMLDKSAGIEDWSR